MIKDWLNCSTIDDNSYGNFTLITVSEKKQVDDDIKDNLGKEILEAYRNVDYLKLQFKDEPEQKLRDYINDYVLPSSKNQITKIVRQGDFGEIIASLIVAYFQGLVVPLQKLRWKFNKDCSVFCTDMIAHPDSNPIEDVHYYEVKTKLNAKKTYPKVGQPGVHITIVAHNSLIQDSKGPMDGIADFLSKYYYELNDYEKSNLYGEIVKNPKKIHRNYELFFIIEHKEFIIDILTDLNSLRPLLKPLNVTVVLIKRLGRLIINTQRIAIDQAVKSVYDK